MTSAFARTRPVGATAVLGRTGFPQITSATGGRLDIVTGASQPGFNPLDLLYASLSACMAMSIRYAASRQGLSAGVEAVTVAVSGEKTTEGPERVTRFLVDIRIDGTLDDAEKAALVARAEHEICTVSNTLHASSGMVTRLIS